MLYKFLDASNPTAAAITTGPPHSAARVTKRRLKIKFPHVAENSKYRWSIRVDNIRKRIWLLLKHVST